MKKEHAIIEPASSSPEEYQERLQYRIMALNESKEQKERRLRILQRMGPYWYNSWITPTSFVGDSDKVMMSPNGFFAQRCQQEVGSLGVTFQHAPRVPTYTPTRWEG